MNWLSVAGWAYLLLGFSSGTGLLMSSGMSLLSGGGMLYDWGTIIWAVAIFALSLFGWALLRNFRTVETRLGALIQQRRHSQN